MFFRNMRLLLSALCVFTMGALSAEETNQEELITLTPAEEAEIQSQRTALMPAELLKSSGLVASMYHHDDDAPYLHRIHTNAYYYPVAVTGNGSKVQLHDASVWHVHPYHAEAVRNWVSSDPIFIKPKSSCFSMYQYVLHNRVTQEAVEVNLAEPPLPTGLYTRWVIGFSGDAYNRIVYLNDNTAWCVNPNDYSYNKWQVGHRVIIGVNNKWRVTDYPHILINTNIYGSPYCEADFTY